MTPPLPFLYEASAQLPGNFPWLAEVLACPWCREAHPPSPKQERPCSHIETYFSLRNGIVSSTEAEDTAVSEAQRKFCVSLEKARGTYDLPLERIVQLPEDAESRALLDWLRGLCRGRAPGRILELNAGRGWAARALAADGHQVVASDPLDDPHIGLGCAVQLRAQTGQPFACVCHGPSALPFRSGVFDCVYCFATLRQIADPERFFQEISRVLRPGGLFVALQEPFRGHLTTQTQRLLDAASYKLARWWMLGALPSTAAPEIVHLRSRLGATLHENRRRAAFYLACGEEAGLQTTVLPTAVALSLPPDLTLSPANSAGRPTWLNALAGAYGLDQELLGAALERASQAEGRGLALDFLNHWIHLGNIDGVLLARKSGGGLSAFPMLPVAEPARLRRLDTALLGCTPDGFVPIYGVHAVQTEEQQRYCWIQPQAGVLVPGCSSLEVTVSCPAKPLSNGPVRVEFRLESERLPLAILLVCPGQRVTLKLPIPPAAGRRASLFVAIAVNFGFLPSDANPGPGCDTRLLAVQLHALRARRAA